MGKHKPVHIIEKCDEWLSTRTKQKISTAQTAGKKAILSRPLRNIGNNLLTQNSPPPLELMTHTKQSTLTNFVSRSKKLPEFETTTDEQSESLEELPTFTGDQSIQKNANKNYYETHQNINQLPNMTGDENRSSLKGDNFEVLDNELPPLVVMKHPVCARRNRNNKTNHLETSKESGTNIINEGDSKDKSSIKFKSKTMVLDDQMEYTDDSSPLEKFHHSLNSLHDTITYKDGEEQFIISQDSTDFHEIISVRCHLPSGCSDLDHILSSKELSPLDADVNCKSKTVKHNRNTKNVTYPGLSDVTDNSDEEAKLCLRSCWSNILDYDTEYDLSEDSEQLEDNKNSKTDIFSYEIDDLSEKDMIPNNYKSVARKVYHNTENDNVDIDLECLTEVTTSTKHSRKCQLGIDPLNTDLELLTEVSVGGRNLISTQEADKELENFSLETDSQEVI